MRLRNPKSFFTTAPEPAPPARRGARVTHYAYLLALVSLLGYLGYLVADHFMFLEARGRVQVETIAIAAERGGRIAALPVREGQRLERGALVARLAPTENCGPASDARLQRLQVDVALARVTIENLNRTLGDKRERLDGTAHLRRALEIDTRASREQRELGEEITRLENELALKRRELGVRTEQIAATRAELESQVRPRACSSEELRSPARGEVLFVGYNADEVVPRAEPIATFAPADGRVGIDAWVESDRLDLVQAGKKMTIVFPDGTRGAGVVESIRSAAYQATGVTTEEEIRDGAGLLLRIVPADRGQRQRWLAYRQMDVTVRASR